MIRREVAWRILSMEFTTGNKNYVQNTGTTSSDVNGNQYQNDEYGVNYVITPFGARVNRVYVCGQLESFTPTDSPNAEQYTGIITDLTGSISFKTSNFSKIIDSDRIDEMKDTSGREVIVAIIGKYQLEPSTIISGNGGIDVAQSQSNVYQQYIKVETVKIVDRSMYNRWLLETYYDLIARIDFMSENLKTINKLDGFVTNKLDKKINGKIVYFSDSFREYRDLLNEQYLMNVKERLQNDVKSYFSSIRDRVNEQLTASVKVRIKELTSNGKSEIPRDVLRKEVDISDDKFSTILDVLNKNGEILITKNGLKYIGDVSSNK